jgi:hypothetical protein
MSRPRLSLAGLLALVLYIGFGVAALRNADRFWASATFTLAIITLSIALTCAFTRKGRTRTTWTGFAVFGWAYLLIVLLPPRHTGGFGFGPIPWPHLLIEWGIASLQPYIKPFPPGVTGGGAAGNFLLPYDQVNHSLGIILFGLVGAILSRLVAEKDE